MSGIFWRMAWRSLGRNKRRHLLNGTAVAIGFCGMVLLGGYMLRMERYLATQSIYLLHTGHVTVFKADGRLRHLSQPAKFSLSPDEQKLVENEVKAISPNVQFVGRILKGVGLASNGCDTFPVQTKAVEPELESWARGHEQVRRNIPEIGQLAAGQGYWLVDPKAHPMNVSPRLAQLLGKKRIIPVANPVEVAVETFDCDGVDRATKIATDPSVQVLSSGFHGGFSGLAGLIVGHATTGLAFTDETALSLPLKSAQVLFDTEYVTSMPIYLASAGTAPSFARELRERLAKKGLNVDAFPYTDDRVSEFYVGAMTFVYVMVAFFLVLVCGIVVLAVANSLYISLLERRAEIATLRAIGFKPDQISGLFLRENFLLSLLSFATGGVLAVTAAALINWWNIRFFIPGLAGDLQFRLEPGFVFSVIVMVILAAVVAAATLATCKRFTRQRITELMGHI